MRKSLIAFVTVAAALALQPVHAAGTAGSAPRAASLVVGEAPGVATSKAKKKSTKKKSTKRKSTKKAACANGARRDAKGNCPA